MVMFEKFTDRELKEIIVRWLVQDTIGSDEKVIFFLKDNITTPIFFNKTVVPLTILLNYKVR